MNVFAHDIKNCKLLTTSSSAVVIFLVKFFENSTPDFKLL